MDRNQLEQEAMRQLNLGSLEGAFRAYSGILKLDPRDRRIRQKVGELMLKMGRPADAEKHFREVVDGLVKEGAHRAAVAVLKQLVALRPDDAGLQMELAECLVASGYVNDARVHFDAAMRSWIGSGRALDAARAATRVSDLTPGEPPLRLKVAELLEAGGDVAGAAAAYREVAEEYRRRGRPDEVGRIAEMALRLVPDDKGLLLDAAAARIEALEYKRALAHLQVAFGQGPREPRTLDLLARAFEGVGQADKALKVLTELARVAAERSDAPGEVDALRRAARLSSGDEDLQTRLSAAEAKASRRDRRLHGLALAQPTTDAEVRAQVRAEVYARYGFVDRAASALRDGLFETPDSRCLLAAMAELDVTCGRVSDALLVMERLLPGAGEEEPAVRERMAIVSGEAAPSSDASAVHASSAASGFTSVPEVPLGSERSASAATPVTAAPAPTAEARGDACAARGDLPGALMAYRDALAENPLDEGVLLKIASLRTGARASEASPIQPVPASHPNDELSAFADFGPPEDGTFAEVLPDALDALDPVEDLDEARSLVAVGMWSEALVLLEGGASLDAAVLRSQAVRGLGDVARALDVLRESVNDALESDPAYPDALFELSALYTATGKPRAALRLLEELKDLDPGYRVVEVDARLRGLQRLAR